MLKLFCNKCEKPLEYDAKRFGTLRLIPKYSAVLLLNTNHDMPGMASDRSMSINDLMQDNSIRLCDKCMNQVTDWINGYGSLEKKKEEDLNIQKTQNPVYVVYWRHKNLKPLLGVTHAFWQICGINGAPQYFEDKQKADKFLKECNKRKGSKKLYVHTMRIYENGKEPEHFLRINK